MLPQEEFEKVVVPRPVEPSIFLLKTRSFPGKNQVGGKSKIKNYKFKHFQVAIFFGEASQNLNEILDVWRMILVVFFWRRSIRMC